MTETASFAERIRARYPEGLTGVFSPGGTRTTFLLEHQRNQENPGAIPDFAEYANYGFDRLFDLVQIFFDLGGQNLIVPLFSYQGFYERGPEYAEHAARLCLTVIDKSKVDFYERNNIDPYLVGIDTLHHLPEDQFAHQLGREFKDFQSNWSYQEGRRKIIWEVAPIPLFSFWRAGQVMGEQEQLAFEASLEQSTDLRDMHDKLYRYYARAVYGTDIPMPQFYLGSNRNGDIKLRSMLPLAMVCGGPFRMFLTPYPSLFTTHEVMQAVLEDLAFGKPLRSTKIDYSGQITADLLEAEYQRVLQVSSDPNTILGMVRKT
ncbi:MAG: hypothetical protein H0X30_06910 [Anaerolineae bacterium]|nr:hypothetical protein [Anaerolineae bacterium]